MANTKADDSTGVAVEVSIPGANDNDISDIENDSDFPSPAEINGARSRAPSRPLDAYEVQLAGSPRSAATIAFDAVAPDFDASINDVPPLRRPSTDTSAGDDDARTRSPWLVETLCYAVLWADSPWQHYCRWGLGSSQHRFHRCGFYFAVQR